MNEKTVRERNAYHAVLENMKFENLDEIGALSIDKASKLGQMTMEITRRAVAFAENYLFLCDKLDNHGWEVRISHNGKFFALTPKMATTEMYPSLNAAIEAAMEKDRK